MVKIKVDYAQVTMDFNDRWVVMVSDEQGREYSRSDVNFIEHDNAVAFRDRITERGYLNAELWDCRTPTALRLGSQMAWSNAQLRMSVTVSYNRSK